MGRTTIVTEGADGRPHVEVEGVVVAGAASGTIDVVHQPSEAEVKGVLQSQTQVDPGLKPRGELPERVLVQLDHAALGIGRVVVACDRCCRYRRTRPASRRRYLDTSSYP